MQSDEHEIARIDRLVERLRPEIEPPIDLWPAVEAAISTDAERVDALARRMPAEIEPPRDLWPAIAARLDVASSEPRPQASIAATAAPRPPRAPYGRPGRDGWLAAASVGFVAICAALFALVLHDGDPIADGTLAETQRSAPDRATERQETQVASPDIEDWLLAQPSLAWNGAGTAAFGALLEEIDRALRDDLELVRGERRTIERAIEEQPADPNLRALWRHAYQAELALTNAVAQIIMDYHEGYGI